MLVLFETAAGFALFKVLQEGKLSQATDLFRDFETLDAAQKVVKLKSFSKFEDTTEALAAATGIIDGKLSKGLKKFLKKSAEGEDLAVLDTKLGQIVKEKLGIPCVHSNAVMELARGIRSQIDGLISGISAQDLTPMSLGLSHSLSRYKLKFSPDKVDTMIVQAIGLLDDLDKELNTYAMRVREWYGWHFPEMSRIVTENVLYAKTVKLMQDREKAADTDFQVITMDEEMEASLKEAAVISMGTEISSEDMSNIVELCDQVISLSDYRGQLYDYLKARMQAIAPNLTTLVGELVGARLIAHAGSLLALAKHPASTVQILGAEKALFRALKSKHDTPKYGLIYHASLVGQAAPKLKGKVSRILAAKAALSIRIDALQDDANAEPGLQMRAQVETRLRQMEGRGLASDSAKPRGGAAIPSYDASRQGGNAAMVTDAAAYNPDADVTADAAGKPKKKKKRLIEEISVPEVTAAPQSEAGAAAEPEKKKKKKKSKAADADGDAEALAATEALLADVLAPQEAAMQQQDLQPEGAAAGGKKKKKQKAANGLAAVAEATAVDVEAPAPKKKKKKATGQ